MGQYCVLGEVRLLTCKDRSLRAKGTDPTTRKAKKPLNMEFDPEKTDLDKPKHGQEDPTGAPHTGGNTFAGGVRCTCSKMLIMFAYLTQTGGRDTAGLGGRGGYKRLYKKGHDIHQVGHLCTARVPALSLTSPSPDFQ